MLQLWRLPFGCFAVWGYPCSDFNLRGSEDGFAVGNDIPKHSDTEESLTSLSRSCLHGQKFDTFFIWLGPVGDRRRGIMSMQFCHTAQCNTTLTSWSGGLRWVSQGVVHESYWWQTPYTSGSEKTPLLKRDRSAHTTPGSIQCSTEVHPWKEREISFLLANAGHIAVSDCKKEHLRFQERWE